MVAAILAGGENTRYPSPKAFIEVRGEPIIERTIRVLKSAGCENIVISTNEHGPYEHLGLQLIEDSVKGAGPMGGLISVFEKTGADEVLAAACDMPFITQEIVQYIIANKGGPATVPVMDGRPQPLLAYYARSAIGPMRASLAEGRRSLTGLVKGLGARFLEEKALRSIEPEGLSFLNINAPGDYELMM